MVSYKGKVYTSTDDTKVCAVIASYTAGGAWVQDYAVTQVVYLVYMKEASELCFMPAVKDLGALKTDLDPGLCRPTHSEIPHS